MCRNRLIQKPRSHAAPTLMDGLPELSDEAVEEAAVVFQCFDGINL